MNCAAISATSASKLMSQPYSSAYSAPCLETIQPMSPGRWLRSRKPAGFCAGGSSVCSIVVIACDGSRAAPRDQACRAGRRPRARAAVEFGKGRAAFRRQCEFGGPAVGLRWFSRDDLAPLQGLQGTAEVTGIETERADQIGRGAGLPFGDFVDDPRFLQRPRAVEQFRFDDAEFAGVEAAEAAHRRDLALEFGMSRYLISSNDYLTKSSKVQLLLSSFRGASFARTRHALRTSIPGSSPVALRD